MNVIFTLIFLLSVSVFLFVDPNGALAAMTQGCEKAVALSLTLLAVYCVWMGILEIADKSGLLGKLSSALAKPVSFLFPIADEQTRKHLAVNLGANLLGMGGVATPAGIAATTLMSGRGDGEGVTTLFVLASASVQILPTTVVGLRLQAGSRSPADVYLPTLLSGLTAAGAGLILCRLTAKRKGGTSSEGKRKSAHPKKKRNTI